MIEKIIKEEIAKVGKKYRYQVIDANGFFYCQGSARFCIEFIVRHDLIGFARVAMFPG